MGGMCFALAGSAVPLWRKSTFLGQQPTSHSSLHRARERPKRGSTATVRAFQVTFQTPDGDQKFECDGAQKCIYKGKESVEAPRALIVSFLLQLNMLPFHSSHARRLHKP